MIREESKIFGLDVDDLIRRFRTEIKHDLRILAEYDTETFRNLYVSESVLDEYGGREAFGEKTSRVESYLRTDFLERNTYSALVPRAGEAHLFVTETENQLFIRLFVDEKALFACMDYSDGSIDPAVAQLEEAIDAH